MKTIHNDVLLLRGCIEMQLLDARDNTPVGERKSLNTVVTAGRLWVLNKLQTAGASTQSLSHMAVGTSATAPATGDTALTGENLRKAVGTQTLSTTQNPPYISNEVLFATNEANTTLKEAGLFNSSSGGTMLSHVTFADIVKSTSNTLSITFSISN